MKQEPFKYEIRYCTEYSETVIETFYSEFDDLTSEDDRCPYGISSQEYLICVNHV